MPLLAAEALHLAAAISPVDGAADSLIGYLLGWGPIGVGIVLFGIGYIVPKPILTEARSDAGKWRKAFEDERAAHAATRESLAVANDRAEAAVEAARVTTKLLEVLQVQRKDT
jgi:hypothetical protein